MAQLRVKTPGLWGVDSDIRDLPLFRNYGDIPVIDQDQVVTVHRRPPAKIIADNAGRTYEEVNWAYLSPAFRAAHNRLRQQRGLPTIPPPKVDHYVPPPPSTRQFDPTDKEVIAGARQFIGQPFPVKGGEGFTIQGHDISDADLARKARASAVRLGATSLT